MEITIAKVGRIIIPDTEKEVPRTGKVIAVGVGTYTISGELIPMQYKVGDMVYYPAFGGQKITIGTKEYVCMKDQDVLTAIEE